MMTSTPSSSVTSRNRQAGRVLAGFQPPAGQFPLPPLVFKQHNPTCLEQHGLDRDREQHDLI